MSFVDKVKAKVEEVKSQAHEAKADHDDEVKSQAINDVKEDISDGDDRREKAGAHGRHRIINWGRASLIKCRGR